MLNRADYNAARHAESPIQGQTNGKDRGPADAAAPATASGGDRRAEYPAPRRTDDAGNRDP